ncbi:amino acid ABC transporter substrate-binding protein [Sinanaerobacter chloroacetimidivorans]|jgi:polar amino acid transport system substrate-binding protein|uniref:Amino acid ABC transporter substrate-binding protein n=1 Tax=Sinanaerobacter chloroacetimidivorans TaxID=2818044 RepID=A0A8J7VY08_9FIRM|nr:amino acid ABC transporter substrate-binding protein [Sinanaerobacter chloroacetimidivorans]MBR0596781.1 amino acid ABC transporter substrate-binding protein [Sinanaerobacter chloroacetimidivorans]
MFKKVSLLLVLVLMMSVFAVGCGGGETQEPAGDVDTSLTDLQEKGTLIIGCDDAFPPMGFIGDDGEIIGFDIDLGKMVAEKLGVEAVIQPIDWSAKEMELNSGNIDVIWNGYTITAERIEQVEFTKPYLNNQQVLVVAADSPYQTKADLEGKIVGAQVESAGLDALKADEAFSSALADMPEYDDYLYALMDLGTSRLDAVAVDKILIGYTMQQTPGKYRVLDEGLADEYYGIGCAKGSVALREAIDKALDELWEDGSIEALSTKWFGENIVIRDVEQLTADDFK